MYALVHNDRLSEQQQRQGEKRQVSNDARRKKDKLGGKRMFIVPITNSSFDISKINSFISGFEGSKVGREEEPQSTGFKELFQDLIKDVEKTEAIAEEDAYKLSIGALDDPHTAMINATKAELTLSTMVQIRNKVLDAYSEIMRTSM